MSLELLYQLVAALGTEKKENFRGTYLSLFLYDIIRTAYLMQEKLLKMPKIYYKMLKMQQNRF